MHNKSKVNINFINEPDPDLYLYKYIKSKHLDDFLEGKLYMSPLIKFNEFYEGIDYKLFVSNYLVRKYINDQLKKRNMSFSSRSFSTLTDYFQESWLKEIIKLNENIHDEVGLNMRLIEILDIKDQLITEHQLFQEKNLANCWFSTTNPTYEPNSMWNFYSDRDGILFKTNYRYLKIHLEHMLLPSLNEILDSNFRVFVGLIKYRDFLDENCWNQSSKEFHKAFYKEDSFKDEHEFRILLELDNKCKNEIYLTSVFPAYLMNGTIVLHPESSYDQIERINHKLEDRIKLNFELSKHSSIVTAINK